MTPRGATPERPNNASRDWLPGCSSHPPAADTASQSLAVVHAPWTPYGSSAQALNPSATPAPHAAARQWRRYAT